MKKRRLPVDQVRERARGHWLEIVGKLCPTLDTSVRFDQHRPCPVHGGEDGFRFFPDGRETGGGICNSCGSYADGFSLIGWINGWSFRETVLAVMSELGLSDDSLVQERPACRSTGTSHPVKPADRRHGVLTEEQKRARSQILNKLWDEAVPLMSLDVDSLPAGYFRHRGIDWDLAKRQRVLRFHPDLMYVGAKDEPDRRLPAIIARFHLPSGRPVTFHRTFLDPDGRGKADVLEAKRMMKCVESPSGGAIRLQGTRTSSDIINVCEGLETGLSILEGSLLDTYVCTTANLLEAFVPPPGKRVLIWADADLPKITRPGGIPIRCGDQKAEALLQRLRSQGITAAIRRPFFPVIDRPVDWNDIHVDLGISGIIAGLYDCPPTKVH